MKATANDLAMTIGLFKCIFFLVYVGVGVVDESRLIKKADVLRIPSSFGESCRSEGDPLGETISSVNRKIWQTYRVYLA